MNFTEKQQKAIKSLERALKKVSDSGIGLIGMDTQIYAVPNGFDLEWPNRSSNKGELKMLKDYGCYLDSGAW